MSIPPAQVRIAFLTDIITPYMVAVLDALGHRADLTAVFCSHTGTRGMAWQVNPPFPHEVVGGLTIRRRSPDATDFYLSPRIVSALHRARPHAIISGGFSIPSAYAAAYCHARRIPLLVHSDGTSRSETRLRVEQRVGRLAIRRLAWGAVANSEPAAHRFIEIGFRPDRVFCAPHAAQIQALWDVADRRVGREGSMRLLAVGRLIPRKGYQWLLRAVARARLEGADVDLTIAGTGPDEGRLRALADELDLPVAWLGFVDGRELLPVYAAADAFAFPSLEDPFGIVLLEAAAAGLPLVASPHAGATQELVAENVNGFVVDPTDVTAMAAAIAQLAGDPALRARMGRAARAVTRHRTPADCAAGYMRAVEQALSAYRA